MQQWKSFYLVLRPNLLSLYKDSSESRLLKQISLSDLTAVAYLKDPKGRREHVFGVFSPSRNFHLQASSQADAQEWVERIKQEARLDGEQPDLILQSPTAEVQDSWREQHERMGSSSPEPLNVSAYQSTTTRDGIRIPGLRRPSRPSLDYSGDETGAYASDCSDLTNPPAGEQHTTPYGSVVSPKQRHSGLPSAHQSQASQALTSDPRPASTATRNASYSSLPPEPDPGSSERTIRNGYLLALKTNRAGVRQWKKMWVVLRSKNLAFYKSDDEYAAMLIIPLGSCIDAVEIDPLSRSKKYCMQVITEEKGYRFCADSEDSLAEWLGALKMQFNRRKAGRGK